MMNNREERSGRCLEFGVECNSCVIMLRKWRNLIDKLGEDGKDQFV